MKISIITVCFNSEKTIQGTIESVLSQDYPDVEYIVVDGDSTDRTMDIVRGYGNRISKVISEPDAGIYDAMNKGVRAATGTIVGILNSDDFYESTRVLSDVANCFKENNSAELVFGDVVFVKPADVSQIVRHYGSSRFRPWKLRFGWMPPHPATFVKRSVYQRAGLYGLSYKISADYEMFVRWLLVKKVKYARLDQILVRMRAGGVSTSGIRSSILLNREIVKACKDNGLYTNIFLVLSKFPFKLLELARRP